MSKTIKGITVNETKQIFFQTFTITIFDSLIKPHLIYLIYDQQNNEKLYQKLNSVK